MRIILFDLLFEGGESRKNCVTYYKTEGVYF
jgi:hypothetical protein